MSQESAQFQALMDQGHSAAWEKDWEKALLAYRQALQENPEDAMALSSAGLACFQLDRFDEALGFYQRCAAITPDDPMPFEKMARIYEHNGSIAEAVKAFMHSGEKQLKARNAELTIAAFKEAIRLDAQNQTARMRLAMIYDKMGLKSESIAEYLVIAALMQAGGDPTKAMQAVQYTLQLDAANKDAQNAMQILKSGQQLPLPQPAKGNSEPVRAAQEKQAEPPEPARESQPKYDPIAEARLASLKEIAGLLFENGDPENAEAQPTRKPLSLLTWGTGPLSPRQAERSRMQSHLSRTIDLQTAGKDDEAAVELERAINLSLEQPAAEFLLGLLTYERSAQKAMKHLQKSVHNPVYALASFLLMAKINEASKQTKEAALHYLQALRMADIQTASPELENELSQLYEPIIESQMKVDDEKKLDELCRSVEKQLLRADWREYLKQVRTQLPSQAEGNPPTPLAEMLLETNTSQVIEALAYIKRLASEGKSKTAMEEAFNALVYAPTYMPLHIQIGELLIQEGRIHEAVEKFIIVATLYNVKSETGQAVRLLTRVAKLAPMDLSIRSMLINLLISSGRTDEAIQQYMDIANVHYLLAELDLAKKNYKEAFALASKSTDAKKWAVAILNKMADIELQSLDLKEAIKILEQLRNLDPQEASTRATLVDLYLRIGLVSGAMNELDAYLKLLDDAGQHHSAERFLEELLEDRPDHVDIQKRLVRFYQTQNRSGEIVEKLDALAEKCLRQENREGALATLHNLISLNPPNVNDYRKLYEELKRQNG